MRKAILAAGLAGLVSACGTFAGSVQSDPGREVLGVAAHQASLGEGGGADAAVARKLDWKASQLCTTGYEAVRQDVESAERDQQLVDWHLRCRPYGLSVLGVPLAGIVPAFAPSDADR
jgi:hypothetical protein